MAILWDEVRGEPCAVQSSPSIREVCLLGIARPNLGWSKGTRVAFSGRVYRVEANQAHSGWAIDAPRYLHVQLRDEEATGGT